jgi:hypothetical protein
MVSRRLGLAGASAFLEAARNPQKDDSSLRLTVMAGGGANSRVKPDHVGQPLTTSLLRDEDVDGRDKHGHDE